jgi:hypothetical protein
MGLDWEPFGKPKPGCEPEYWTLVGQLTKEEHWLQPSPVRHSPIPAGESWESLRKKLQAIEIPPYEALRAPRVGSDPAADAWIRSQYGNVPNRPAPVDEWVRKFDGFYVVALVPENDGLPVYSNHGLSSSFERWSFRAQFLRGCEDILGDALLKEAWVRHTASQLADYGKRLMSCATAYAETHGVADVLALRSLDNVAGIGMADVAYVGAGQAVDRDDTTESPRFKAHLIASAARWAAYWASHGHGLYANY